MSKDFDDYLKRKLSDAKAHEATPTQQNIAQESVKNRACLILVYGITVSIAFLYLSFNSLTSKSTFIGAGAIIVLPIILVYVGTQITSTVFLIKNYKAIKQYKLATKYKRLSLIGFLITWLPIIITIVASAIVNLPK